MSTETDDNERLKTDDLQYVEDLGLITLRPPVAISNRIYQEVIPRELTWSTQVMIPNQEQTWYVDAQHRLDLVKLLQAFLQRIINGARRPDQPGIRSGAQAY